MTQQKEKTGFSCLATGITIVFGGLLITIIVINIGGRIVINKQIKARFANDPQVYEKFLRYLDEPVNVPDEWFELLTVSGETQQKFDRFKTYIKNHNANNLTNTIDQRYQKKIYQLTPDELNAIRQDIEAEAEAVAVARELIDAPDYDLGLFLPPIVHAESPQSLINMQHVPNTMMALASIEALDGKWAEALDIALAASRTAKRRPCNTLIIHLVGIAIQNNAQRGIARLAQHCSDASLLRDVRLKLQQMEPYVLPRALDWALEADTIASLQGYQRAGFEADLTPGKPLFCYSKQVVKAMQWSAQQANPAQPPMNIGRFSLARYLGLGEPIDRLMFVWSEPNLENGRIREKATIAEYEVISAYLAARIAELENGAPAESPELLEKDYLGIIPEDPFTKQPLLWDGTRKAFYSVGPDITDDDNQNRYDPSNGMVSSGDVFPIGEW